MKMFRWVAAVLLTFPAAAFAHVSVAPREAKPGAQQQYTVRVPTERQVATTAVYLQVPDGMTVTDVPQPEGATHDLKKDGTRIVAITWTKAIPPKQSAQFLFTATNPAGAGQIAWKVQQRFADGTSRDWTPGTKLTDTPAVPAPPPAATQAAGHAAGNQMAPASGDTAPIEKWLAAYDAAFNAKDLDRLATFYHPDATIYEGGGINRGWADYRDHHLGPELKAFANLQFAHSDTLVRMTGPDSAYATSAYSLKAKMGERDIDSGGLETLVLVKEGGAWKIRHSHTSSRPRRPAAVR
ncbi:MAG TPA: DUF1775 domain-containing protein [Gemmatimonadaceae bacterium]|nr:DUF1775 domain-containing protein [Gemmatimonadaceae bacterium]